jgi:hypothetical protein
MNSEGAKTRRGSGFGRGLCLRTSRLCCFVVQRLFFFLTLLFCGLAAEAGPVFETNATNVAKLLAGSGTWLLPQPKAVALTGDPFDLGRCEGIRLVGCDEPWLQADFPALLQERCGVLPKVFAGKPGRGCISLVLCPHEMPPPGVKSLTPQDLAGLGEQGYCLRVEPSGITAGAATEQGLYYAARTLAQIANGRTRLPGMVIRDWPSLRWRGFQYDISRG